MYTKKIEIKYKYNNNIMNIKDYRVQNLINYVPNNNRSLILIINYYSIFVSYNLLKCKYVPNDYDYTSFITSKSVS